MLKRNGYQVTIFEKGPKPGFAAHSCDVAARLPIASPPLIGDIPSRMFNAQLWPTVTQLYREAGIEFEAVDQQQTFCRGEDVLLKVASPYRFGAFLKQGFNPAFRKLAGAIATFRDLGNQALESQTIAETTFGEFLDSLHGRFSETFMNGFLYPALTSTVFTCPRSDLQRFPATVVLDALSKITGDDAELMRTVDGSLAAAEKLLAGIDSVHFDAPVEEVREDSTGVVVLVQGERHHFDQLVVAIQANHASQLVARTLPDESALLQNFKYVAVPVVLHTDASILPPRRDDWGTFNFESHADTATCTVWMNRFHRQWPDVAVDVFHSIFPVSEIDPSKVLGSVVMQRPVVDSQTVAFQRELEQCRAGVRKIWFCGSYAWPGVPLLESGVASSKNVVSQICALN